jgi:hypothetical protein
MNLPAIVNSITNLNDKLKKTDDKLVEVMTLIIAILSRQILTFTVMADLSIYFPVKRSSRSQRVSYGHCILT